MQQGTDRDAPEKAHSNFGRRLSYGDYLRRALSVVLFPELWQVRMSL